MKITITIKTDNAAFTENNYDYQIEEILNKMTFMVLSGRKVGYLYDLNGNKVGGFEVEGK